MVAQGGGTIFNIASRSAQSEIPTLPGAGSTGLFYPTSKAGINRFAVGLTKELRAKEAGEERVILFNLSGHGHFDMAAYDAYLAGELTDVVYEPARADADGERPAISEREPVTA